MSTMVMMSRSTIATPPGATVKEQLIDRGMSQKEFASRMGLSEKHVSKLINGEVRLTSDVALRLEMVLGLPAKFWSNLESRYREKLEIVKAENEMDEDIEIARHYPYNDMAKHGWVEKTRSQKERVFNLRKFFEVARLSLLAKNNLIPGIACRRLSNLEKTDNALIAWAQEAKIQARDINVEPINLAALKEDIPTIRAMTNMDPATFSKELANLLANSGIALVYLPHITSSFLHGATFYDKNKIVMGLTVRGRDADRFWFSLFHEIAHVLLGHIGQPSGTTSQDEHDADKFARDTLIPPKDYEAFIERGDFSAESISIFANGIGIEAGIVVGRLQNDRKIPYKSSLNNLKTKYKLVYEG